MWRRGEESKGKEGKGWIRVGEGRHGQADKLSEMKEVTVQIAQERRGATEGRQGGARMSKVAGKCDREGMG